MQLLTEINNGPEKIMFFIKEQAEMTVEKSFKSPSLRSLAVNKIDVFNQINNLLYLTSKSLNVSKNLENIQAFEMVHIILSDYRDIKFDELVYIFKQGKKGLYGAHYNKLDIETITGWINGYFKSEEYNNFLENQHKKPIEKVELTESQKHDWNKIHETLNSLVKKPVYGNDKVLNEKKHNEQIEKLIPTLEDLNLPVFLEAYQKQDYKFGVQLVLNEIKKRKLGNYIFI